MSADFIVPDWPAPANVRALQTTRRGGYSQGVWAGLNLATHVGDLPETVQANRRWLREYLPAEPHWLNQVHGTACAIAGQSPQDTCADASVGLAAQQLCVVMTADCLPVLFCSRDGQAVAAAHAGWRGLLAGVLETTVAQMQVAPSEVLAWLGPAIGPQAFEVGDEVRAAFVAESPAAAGAFSAHGNKWLADLYALARQRLQRAGVNAVYGGGLCTFSQPEDFYSYRRDGVTGRMASLIWRTL